METLHREASIFSAELYAIPMAVGVIGELADMQFVTMSDSFSVLRAISDIRNRYPVIRKMFQETGEMKDRNKEIEMCWITSHVGIQGNEEADRAAETAARRAEQYIRVYYKDWFPEIDRVIKEDSSKEWERKKQKMHEIKRKEEWWKINKKV